MYEYRCKILRVVDGDTVDVDIDLGFGIIMSNERVRIHGIDAPESRTRDLVEKKFGLAAKERVLELLPEGSYQTIKTYLDGKGKFGRILGNFLIANSTLTAILINEGHAVEYHGQSKDDILEQHLINRQQLIDNGSITL